MLFLLEILRFTTAKLAPPSCYSPSIEINDDPIHLFSLPSGSTCKDYCLAVNECETYIVFFENATSCALYKESLNNWKVTPFLGDFAAVRKSCRDTLTTNLTKLVEEDIAEGGVVLQRSDTFDCLGRGEPRSSDKVGFYITWNKECNDSLVWDITVLDYLTFDIELKIKNDENLCLAAELMEEGAGHPRALVIPCNESETYDIKTEGNYLSRGLFIKLDKYKTTVFWSIYSVVDYLQPYVQQSYQDGALALTQLHFVTWWQLLSVRCEGVVVHHGRVLEPLGDHVPFFVAGHKIPVRCDEGYGVKGEKSTFLTEFSVECSRDMTPVNCVPLPRYLLEQCLNNSLSEDAIGGSSRGQLTDENLICAAWTTWFLLIFNAY